MGEALRVGIAGLGTVGASVVRILAEKSAELTRQCGRTISVTAVSARDRNKDRGVSLEGIAWFDDPVELARKGDIDVLGASYEDDTIAWYENDGSQNFTELLVSLDEILAEDVELVLLDNFPVWQTQIAVQRRDARAPGTKLESSGGLSLPNAADYAGTGVDYLAVGALTHSVQVLDLGLDL